MQNAINHRSNSRTYHYYSDPKLSFNFSTLLFNFSTLLFIFSTLLLSFLISFSFTFPYHIHFFSSFSFHPFLFISFYFNFFAINNPYTPKLAMDAMLTKVEIPWNAPNCLVSFLYSSVNSPSTLSFLSAINLFLSSLMFLHLGKRYK